MNIDKIISIVKTLREEAAMAAPTNNVGGGQIAGTREAGDCLLYTSDAAYDW